MKKITLFFITLAMLTLTSYQEMYAMKTVKAGVQYGIPVGYTLWYTKRQINEYKKEGDSLVSRAQPAESNTEKFVLDALHEAYPELKERNIKVISDKHQSFSTVHFEDVDYLLVPLTDLQIERAEQKKKNGEKYPLLEKMKRTKDTFFSNNEAIALLEHAGVAMTANTLDMWHGNILHEGSHIVHHDMKMRLGSNIVPIYAILIASQFIQRKSVLLHLSLALCQMPVALGKWQEYRVDQDAIAHTPNAKVLNAMGDWFGRMPESKPQNLVEKVVHLRSPHPEHATRAAYFKKAAQELEQKQAAQKN